jgi:hypothetical protein
MPATPKAKKPQDHKSKSSNFGKQHTVPVEVPSGSVIEVIRPGVEGLIKAGILESFDSLTGIVQGETIPKAEGKPVADLKEIVSDMDNVRKMTDILNKITMHVVRQPQLVWHYEQEVDSDDKPVFNGGQPVWVLDDKGNPVTIPDEQRDPEIAYVDYVDLEDKTFIMNFAVGGSADLQTFRAATSEALGSLRDGEAAPATAE